MKFHELNISNVEQLTPLSKKITFEIPINLQSDYTFLPGQYVTLELEIDGNNIRRSYSICSSRTDNTCLSIGVKQIENGYASTYINQKLDSSSKVKVSTPEGSFILGNWDNKKSYIFIAGGSGITPFISMLNDILPKQSSAVYLKYSTISQVETMFYEELQTLKNQYPQFHLDLLYTNGENLLNETNLAEWISSQPSSDYEVWVCGPAGIISATEKACNSIGLADSKFHREYFTAKNEADMQSASVGGEDNTAEVLSPGESAEVEIKYEGKKLSFKCKYNETILDAALNAGGDPPYSCLVAACSTCRAMVKIGNIDMKDRDALSDKEIAKGFVLTCQSMPRSKKIVLDYDI